MYDAIRNEDSQKLAIALSKGANINKRTRRGANVLNYCVKKMLNNENINLQFIIDLIKLGAKPCYCVQENIFTVIIDYLDTRNGKIKIMDKNNKIKIKKI